MNMIIINIYNNNNKYNNMCYKIIIIKKIIV